MSNYVSPFEAVINEQAQFGPINDTTINIFPCADGTLAGFKIINLGSTEEPYYVSEIYNSTTGEHVLLGTTSVLPGWDMAGGLFVTGCIPDSDPLLPDTNFYLVDY